MAATLVLEVAFVTLGPASTSYPDYPDNRGRPKPLPRTIGKIPIVASRDIPTQPSGLPLTQPQVLQG
ncbi:hypothetical protein [Varibaculum cambriense]